MGEFEVVRHTVISAQPQQVHALIADLRRWREWSPWEDLDPALRREYSGPESGPGARYSWQGNRKAGAGTMEIVTDTGREVGVRLEFRKPMRATNDVTFTLAPVGTTSTEVAWRMRGERTGLGAVFAAVIPMDRLIGKDFEKGLARLRVAAESGA
ncbi:SRPBCC family protein [Nocardia farcinica]|uniref:SRPBCC family protein n=1 Tax=Nocardia farcinica TaxID=37329 RepID=UPI001893E25D|nr:SRPBCC family protein [Nocardia farcinica]MBF6071048.1 SRPBCC family protein [Nocardia farcinica]MBF6422062.1 SRPBCC family protein [Nocardia farcinica]MBF6433718.1 SRPBCC family protein [Nocardia farcinica]MBF6442965.1 SRPBCC family protein [Nocardia farcinica]MBF6504664.1 SRPBCC family protein [Nocardia farcinica]